MHLPHSSNGQCLFTITIENSYVDYTYHLWVEQSLDSFQVKPVITKGTRSEQEVAILTKQITHISIFTLFEAR